MSESLDEQLSALVDDELDSAELPLLVRQLSGSQTLAGRLERYYVIRDAIRREPPAADCSGLADRVAAAVEAEPAHAGGRRRRRLTGQALKPAAGLAIAASVAVLAVGLWPEAPTTPSPSQTIPASDNIAVLNPQSGTMRVSTGSAASASDTSASSDRAGAGADEQEWNRLDPRVQSWLNGYIVDHSEHAGSAQLGGVINYARIAGQEPKGQ